MDLPLLCISTPPPAFKCTSDWDLDFKHVDDDEEDDGNGHDYE